MSAVSDRPLELNNKEVVVVGKSIFEKIKKEILNQSTYKQAIISEEYARSAVEDWYKNMQRKIDISSRLALTHMIVFLQVRERGYPVRELAQVQESIKSLVVEYQSVDQKARERFAKCLLQSANIYQTHPY